MNLFMHFIINAVIGVLVVLLQGLEFFSLPMLLIMIGGLAIDLDHVFDQIYKGSFSTKARFKKAVKAWTTKANKYDKGLYLFHSYEFMIIVLLVAVFLLPVIIYLLLGMVIHFLSDCIVHYNDRKNWTWLRHYSILWWLKNTI